MDNQEVVNLVSAVIKREISPHLDSIDNRLEAMDQRFEAMENHIGSFEKATHERFDSIENRLGVLDVKADTMHRQFDDLDFKVDSLAVSTRGMDRSLAKDIRLLQDGQNTLVAVLEAKGILPRIGLS